MTYYIVKLLIMLPLMAGLIYGALWLYRKYQPGLTQVSAKRELKLIESLSMGSAGKLALVEFSGQKILVSVSRSQIAHIASTPDINALPNKQARSFGELLDEQA